MGRWRALAGAGFVTTALTATLLTGAAIAAADPQPGPSADAGSSTTRDAGGDRTAEVAAPETPNGPGDDDSGAPRPAEAAGPLGPEENPGPAADEIEDSAPNTPAPDEDESPETNGSGADRVPSEAQAASPASEPAEPTEQNRGAHVAPAPAADKAATEEYVTTAGTADLDRAAAPVEPVDPAVTEPTAAAKPAEAQVRTLAVSLEPTAAEQDSTPATVVVPTAVAAVAEAVGARRPSLVTVIGSLVMNVLMGLIHLVDGAPVLPAGSSVTVRTSSLTLPIGSGRQVEADWYFPETVDDSTRLIYLQHGFMASGPMYSYTAANLAERTNSIVVVPSLSSNFFDANAEWVGGSTMQQAVAKLFEGGRAALAESATAAAGYTVTLPQKFVLVGHSAGGTLVTAVAGYLADDDALDDLAGVVMLDGVEPKGSAAVSDALTKLTGDHYRPIYLISSQRYMWNRHGDMADKLMAARPDTFNGVALADGMHIDYMEGGNALLQFSEYLISGFSHRENIDAAGIIAAGWVNDLFDGTTTHGVYGEPGESFSITTPTGPATAVVLPLGPAGPSPLGEFLDTMLGTVLEYAGEYLFVYDPLI